MESLNGTAAGSAEGVRGTGLWERAMTRREEYIRGVLACTGLKPKAE